MNTTLTARDIRTATAIATMFAALAAIAGIRRNLGDRCKLPDVARARRMESQPARRSRT